MTGRLKELVLARAEVTTLLVVVFAVLGPGSALADRRAPVGTYALGLVAGAALALHAAGLVLVYRANRVINLAQLQLGAVGGLAFVNMANRRTFLRGLDAMCPPCIREPSTVGELLRSRVSSGMPELTGDRRLAALADLRLDDPAVTRILPPELVGRNLTVASAPNWMVQLNYALSLLVAVALTALLVLAVYVFIIRRFNQAPRLILTVATLGAGRFALLFGQQLSGLVFPLERGRPPTTQAAPMPVDATLRIGQAVLSASHIATLLASLAAGAGLFAFLRFSRLGVVLRGAAENAQRAETLGVNISAITARAWVLAGLLSGVAAILTASSLGAASLVGSYDTLVKALTAGVVGGLVSLPLAMGGALVIGTLDEVVRFATGSDAIVSGLILAIVVVLLLAQRARASRAEVETQAAWVASRELRPIPQQLRRLPQVRSTQRALVVIGTMLALGFPWFMSPAQTNLTTIYALYAIIGLSLLILTGWAGQISLAQMAIAALGAYVVAVFRLPLLLGLPLAAVIGGSAAILVGIPALRLRGQYLAIATLAFAVATSSILLGSTALGRRLATAVPRPVLLGLDLDDERTFYYSVLVFLALATVATIGMRRGPIGRHLIACRDNELAAQSFTLQPVRLRATAFAMSGVMASVAGALFVYAQRGLEPASFTPDVSVRLFLMVLIGGLGSVAGPILGAAYLAVAGLLSAARLGPLAGPLVDPGLAVVVILMFAPGGLAQIVFGLRDAWLRRLASRYRIDVPLLFGDRRVAEGATVPVRPKERPGGGAVFIPPRYRLDQQWMVAARKRNVRRVTAGE